MAKFIALPVSQGDAFYLDRGDYTILVDGGKNRSALADMFRRVTGKESVDILVCTHNDSDHVNGVLGFLASELRCNELWLPGRWRDVLPDVLVPLHEFTNKILGEIRYFDGVPGLHGEFRFPESVEELAKRYEPRNAVIEEGIYQHPEGEHHNLKPAGRGWPASIIRDLENAEPWDSFTAGWPHRYWYEWRDMYYGTPESGHKLLLSVIDAASRIREAAILAFHKGVTVRWFEHFPSAPSGGIPGVLVPANAQELITMRQYSGSLVEYISLSVANRESLVFWAPSTDEMPDVLFNADSDLADVTLRFSTENSLATAPHHGSEANAGAYNVVECHAPSGRGESVTWIRSDGQFLKRPGSAYLTKTKKRFCTLCRSGLASFPKPKQTVKLFTLKGRWVRHKNCSPCVCLP